MNKLTTFAAAAALTLLPMLGAVTPAGAQPLTPELGGVCETPNAAATTLAAATPEVPSLIAQQGVTGKTMVQVDIDGDGRLMNVAVAKTSGTYALDLAALRAARQSTFRPEIVNCVGVPGTYLFEVDFPQ